VQLAEMTWTAVANLSKETPIVIPVAAIEQHGYHLPVFTDSMLLGEVIRRAAERLTDRVLFTPVMWLGNSHHHIDFPGTMSASPRVFLDLMIDMAENFLSNGFKRIVFINGHGGNTIPGRHVTFELRQKYRDRDDLLLLFTTYWGIGKRKPYDIDSSLVIHEMGHACEWETSMIMRLAPQLVVGDVTKIDPTPIELPFDPAYRGWTSKDRTPIGHMGDPRTANPEKGETLFRIFTADVVAFLERVIAWNGEFWSC
jgi:creatinine amidohydrolase